MAVVGATGAVGGQIVELLAAREFPAAELKLFATNSGAAGTVQSGDDEHLVEAYDEPAKLADFDLAFLAVPEAVANHIAAARLGPVLIDLSAASRGGSSPGELAAPGLTTRERVREIGARGLLGVPHPAAQALASCLGALRISAGFVAATALLGASSAGRDMIAKTVDQTTDLLRAQLDLEDEPQRAFNALVREHERATAANIARQANLLFATAAGLAVQVVSIPILHGSALSIGIPAGPGVPDRDDDLERLRTAPGLLLIEPGEPLAIADAVGQEAIMVAADLSAAGLALFCAYDNTRLAALSAVWIAEMLTLESRPAN
ncbi:MAG TPA: hypothetical protein VEJ86_14905 [Candidatus Binataceae bacterium]|nr:hypothetical protein [Candidatus Binataceae bacterium]